MTNRLIALMVLMTCATALFAEEPKLTGKVRLFATSQPAYKRPNQHHAFTMRLSPDGKRVLYTRLVIGDEKPGDRSARYEMVLRQLDGGKEAVVPIEPLRRGWRTVFTRFNTFDPAGKRMILPNIKVENVRINENLSSSKMSVTWGIYDIARAKMTSAGIKDSGGMALAKFAADGQALLVSAVDRPAEIVTGTAVKRGKLVTKLIPPKGVKAKVKSFTAAGFIQSVCPVGRAAVFFVPPSRRPRTQPRPTKPEARTSRLVLWDLKADKLLAEIPKHRRNRVLDDIETQWTADGRYLYYSDIEEIPGKGDRPTYRRVARIWDKKTGKPAAVIKDAVPVGPGPGPSMMILSKRTAGGPGGFSLHDAATGKEYILAAAPKELIHACGGKVIYAEKPDQSDSESVFSADIVVPTVLD